MHITVSQDSSAGGFDEADERAEEGVAGVMEQGVEDGLGRQHMHAGVAERGEAGVVVVGAAGADGVGKHGDLKSLGEGAEGGLVNADGRLEADQEQVFDVLFAQGGEDRRIGDGGEGGFGEDGRGGRELAQRGRGGAEFLRHLLGEKDRDAEAGGGGDRERGAGTERTGGGGRQGAEEGILQVHREEGGAGRGGFGRGERGLGGGGFFGARHGREVGRNRWARREFLVRIESRSGAPSGHALPEVQSP